MYVYEPITVSTVMNWRGHNKLPDALTRFDVLVHLLICMYIYTLKSDIRFLKSDVCVHTYMHIQKSDFCIYTYRNLKSDIYVQKSPSNSGTEKSSSKQAAIKASGDLVHLAPKNSSSHGAGVFNS